jgi:superoxide dismutase
MNSPQHTPGSHFSCPVTTTPLTPGRPSRSALAHWVGHALGAAAIATSLYLASAKNTAEAEFTKQSAEQGRRLQEAQERIGARERDLVVAKAETTGVQEQLGATRKQGEIRRKEAGEIIAKREEEVATTKAEAASYQAQLEAALKKTAEAEVSAQQAMKAAETHAEYKLVIDNLTSENDQLQKQIADLKKVTAKYSGVPREKAPHGKVVATQPGWGFTVLNVGDKQGARPNTTYLVARDGNAIGRLKLTSVENNQSVAEILPETFTRGASVRLGDDVVADAEQKAPARK